MKSGVLFLVLLIWILPASAQTRSDVILYAYARAVAGGVAPTVSTSKESSFLNSIHKERYTYLIYLEGPAKTRIYPVEMYIKGERTGVKISEIRETPVQLKTGDLPPYSRTTTLVPKTSNKVYRLDPGVAGPQKEMQTAKTKAGSNEIVVVYKYAGKFYYAAQKKFKLLAPVVLQ